MFSFRPISSIVILCGRVNLWAADSMIDIIMVVDVNRLFDGYSLDDGWRGVVIVVV